MNRESFRSTGAFIRLAMAIFFRKQTFPDAQCQLSTLAQTRLPAPGAKRVFYGIT